MRFKGWRNYKTNKTKDMVSLICNRLSKENIIYKREHKFLKNRKFRFDIALLKDKIAIEYEGGIYNNGRHIRSYGYIKDIEKYNLAVLNGWKLLRYTINDFKNIEKGLDKIVDNINSITNED